MGGGGGGRGEEEKEGEEGGEGIREMKLHNLMYISIIGFFFTNAFLTETFLFTIYFLKI